MMPSTLGYKKHENEQKQAPCAIDTLQTRNRKMVLLLCGEQQQFIDF